MSKKIFLIAVYIGMIIAAMTFIVTKDVRFGFITTWFIICLYHNMDHGTVNVFIEAPQEGNKQQEERHNEGDSHRD